MPNTHEPDKSPSPSPQQGGEGASFDPVYRAVIDAVNHRTIIGSSRGVLSQDERLLLIDPVVHRVRVGALGLNELLGFISGVVHGGVPCADLVRNPTMPLDLTSVDGMDVGRWLPPHLCERRMAPERRHEELDIQQNRIVDAIQGGLRDANVDLPLFFMGSAAAPKPGNFADIDIGTSVSLRNAHLAEYDQVFNHVRDRMSSTRRQALREVPINGDKNHVGAVWSHFHLALGVSVFRHERALRVTSSDVYVIEKGGGAE
jgi:hypothetical protein